MKSKLLKSLLLLMVLAIGIRLQAQTQSPQKALSFNGVNQYVFGDDLAFDDNTCTIEAWVYNNTLPTGAIQRYVTLDNDLAVLRYDGASGVGQLHFYINFFAGGQYDLRADNVLTTGTWMHIAGTWDGTNMKLYLNGNLLAYRSYSGTTYYLYDFTFGGCSNGTEALNGKMDEVRIYNYARSEADIREDMYRTAPDAGLLHYWQFNNGSGTTLTDSKGFSHGTLYNMNNSNWISSTIPFAAGAVNTQIVNSNGTTTFTGTGLSMVTYTFETNNLVVSRIDTLPNQIPTEVSKTEPRYWVINSYVPGSLTANVTFPLYNSITTTQASHPEQVKLYYRSANSDGAWAFLKTATSLNATNGTATFNEITSFGRQYIVCNNFSENYPGTALNFDGTNDYVDCGNASSLNITGAITIEAWINADTWKTNSWEGTIVGKDNNNATGYVLRCGNNGMLSFVIGSAGDWHEVLSGAVMQAGRWNYVAGVYDGANMSIYINGVLSGQQALSSAIGVSTQSLFIGKSPGFPTRFFDGKIDEVRLFNAARTQAQIQGDMCNTLIGDETGLVDYWQCNEGSGTSIHDIVGISNGTLTNMDAATCWVESYAMVVPVPAAASGILATSFTANWEAPAIGTVTSYKLDVSTNTTFTSLVTGYNNVDCGNNLSQAVTGLSYGTTYYYRVRADKTSVTGTGANYYTYTTVTTCNPPAISGQSTPTQTQPLYGTFNAITVTATGDNITYQWFRNTSAVNSGGTSLGSANGAQTYSYTPQASAIGTLYYYCVISGTCGASQTSAVSEAIIVNTVAAGITGTGTPGDPYQITDLDDLQWLQSVDSHPYWAYNFIQTADINAAPSQNWDSGNGFSPIGGGNSSTSFTGTYHGKGHTVDSLYINRPSTGNLGFFGHLDSGTIDSLNIIGNITGEENVGCLVGVAGYSNISYCSTSGSVSSNSNAVGGFVGNNYRSSIKYCYSSANVSSTGSNIGGFCGVGQYSNAVFRQCYAFGLVSGGTYVGGIIGYGSAGGATVDSSYWDTEATGQTAGYGYYSQHPEIFNAVGKTTAEMKTQSTYEGWDFANRWFMANGINNGYPCFYYAPEVSTQAVSNIKTYTATGHGTIVGKGTFITSYGVCYNTTGSPTTADSKVNLGAASYFGAFSANMSGLHHGTTYYVRAFAINSLDTVYGAQVSFTTLNTNQSGTCVKINIDTEYVNVPDNNTLDLTNNYTIEAWIKPQYFPQRNRVIVSKGFNTNGYYLKTSNTGNYRGLVFDGMTTADNILSSNQWYHVAAVNDNGTRHLYLNGVEQPLTGTAITVVANSDPLYINGYFTNITYKYNGWIDEVRLWNTALSFSQIRENMHLPLTGSETGLVSYWQFDEESGTIMYDKMGINNGAAHQGHNLFVTSSIPFGDGFSNSQVVSATGTTTFTNTGLAINFTAKTGMDSIVVARINTFPNINPTGLETVFDGQYWAVHKYGTGTLTANLTFTINEDLNVLDENNPSNIQLYTRSSMADDSSWVLLASATAVNAATNQATFNGITGFSQFIIGKESPTASWAGNTSTAWSGSSNWSSGVVPTAACDIIIPSGTTFSPIVNLAPASPAVCNNLTIQAGAVLTIASGKALTVNGTLTNNAGTGGLVIEAGGSMLHNSDNVNGTVKTYLTGEPFPANPNPCTMYHLVSVPLNPSNNSVSGLFSGGYLYGHVPADNSWLSLGTSTTNDLNEQNGFLVYYSANSTVSFAGPLNNGTFSPVVTYLGLPDNNNFALVPNPYPSKIDWNAAEGWSKNAIGASIWFFSDGNYGVWNGTSGTHGATQYIAPGQAFFVQTTAAIPVLSMTNAVRTHETAVFFKNENTVENQLRVLATGNETADELLIGFKPDCSDIYNPQEDALKIYGSSGVPQIFTSAGETPLTINNLAQPTGPKTVAMSFECEKAGEYSLSFSQIETFAAGIQITLVDELTNQTTNLSNQPVYTFIHNTGNAANRFKLVFGGTIGINEPTANAGKMWIAGNTLFISAPKLTGQTGLLEIYSATGQKMMSKTIVLNEFSTLELNFKGFVVARLTAGNEVLTVKGILMK
jgi:hypothetical protein